MLNHNLPTYDLPKCRFNNVPAMTYSTDVNGKAKVCEQSELRATSPERPASFRVGKLSKKRQNADAANPDLTNLANLVLVNRESSKCTSVKSLVSHLNMLLTFPFLIN